MKSLARKVLQGRPQIPLPQHQYRRPRSNKDFAVGPDGLYFIGDTGTPAKHRPGFKFFDFATRKITVMEDMEKFPFHGAPGLSVSPDGKYLLRATRRVTQQLDDGRKLPLMCLDPPQFCFCSGTLVQCCIGP